MEGQEGRHHRGGKHLSMKRLLVAGIVCSYFIQGSSALHLVPALQPRVSRVVNFVRGKTWLAIPFGTLTFAALLGREPKTKEDCQFCLGSFFDFVGADFICF